MRRFIKAEQFSGGPVLINLDNITYIEKWSSLQDDDDYNKKNPRILIVFNSNMLKEDDNPPVSNHVIIRGTIEEFYEKYLVGKKIAPFSLKKGGRKS